MELKLHVDHEHADKNGKPCNLRWGHLFEGQVIRPNVIQPLFITGFDETPRSEETDG